MFEQVCHLTHVMYMYTINIHVHVGGACRARVFKNIHRQFRSPVEAEKHLRARQSLARDALIPGGGTHPEYTISRTSLALTDANTHPQSSFTVAGTDPQTPHTAGTTHPQSSSTVATSLQTCEMDVCHGHGW